ncbi:MAG TPA: hypothetical protein DCD96_05110 [Flavobacteriales bacterium]|nr:hypothetical protein [Flavobacteriales bacterium]HRE74735.1 hypothetical protein [Flavobacteriales bacterium]HRJ35677.1 hypothetical protein [Flavobacteriales bacterium]HRJ37963.1 hypothetical protein [Flavobacteriales bacterium]
MLPFLQHIADSKEKKLNSIELAFMADGMVKVLYPVQFLMRKKGVEFAGLEEVSNLPSEWKKTLNKEIALLITFSGKGIITKRIEKGEGYNFHIRTILPNANPEEFYWQVIDCRDHQMVSVIRKTQIDDFLKEVCASNYLIAGVFLGAINAFPLAGITGSPEISASGFRIEMEANEPSAIVPDQNFSEELFVDGKKILPTQLVAVGSGFGYYSDVPGIETSYHTKEELGYRNLLNKIGFGALAVLMIILGFNYYFRNYYQERFLLLSEIMTATAGERQEMAGIQLELGEKRELIHSTGLSMHHWLSYYANDIGESVPLEIVLTDMIICPLQGKRMEPGEPAEFLAGQILITGTTPGSEILHQWVERLKSRDWAREVIVESFKQKEDMDLSQFTLQITLS